MVVQSCHLFNNAPIGAAYLELIAGQDIDFVIHYVNQSFAKIISSTADQLIGSNLSQIACSFIPEWIHCFSLCISECVTKELDFISPSGTAWYKIQAYSPATNHCMVLITDITDQVKAHHTTTHQLMQLQQIDYTITEHNQLLSDIIEYNGALIYAKDIDGYYTLVNKQWELVTGLSRDMAIGEKDLSIFPGISGENFHNNDLSVIRSGEVLKIEETTEIGYSQKHFISIKIPMKDSQNRITGVCSISTDITELKEAELQIQILLHQLEVEKTYAEKNAMTDALTGIANRRQFDETLNREFYRSKRMNESLSLIMIDVDYFKKYNDCYGHIGGDECLQAIASELRKTVKRNMDVLCRYGGEEFVVIMPSSDLLGATLLAEQIRKAIAALEIPHEVSSISEYVTVSLGIATYTEHLEIKLLEQLIIMADQALYSAKQNGRNRVSTMNHSIALTDSGHPQTSFVRLVWNLSNECGVSVIDNQHHQLFELSNHLLTAVLSDAPKTQCTEMIQVFLEEVVQHFSDEEAILESSEYLLLNEHKDLHRLLVSKGQLLAQKYMDDQMTLGELFNFLAYEVVAKHMFIDDKKFFPYL